MKCHICGGELEKITTDLPFKRGGHSIVILKDLPVLQCDTCSEFLIEDPVMERIEVIMQKIDTTVEIEVLNFAA